MDQADLDGLIQLGQLVYVLLISPPCRTLNSVALYRVTDKVILWISYGGGAGAKTERVFGRSYSTI